MTAVGLKIKGRTGWVIGAAAALVMALAISMVVYHQSQIVRADSINTTDFVTTWKTDNQGGSCDSCITLPIYGDYSVDWNNDGIVDEAGLTQPTTHDFGVPGEYTIRIPATSPSLSLAFEGSDDREKIIDIGQWGDYRWNSLYAAFKGAARLSVSATDAPDLSAGPSLFGVFSGASSMNADLSSWDTSNVTNMATMFTNASSFNGSVAGWDTSNVTDMTAMFSGAANFNQDLSSWDTSNVTSTSSMFYNATSFNQDLSSWDVGNVENMSQMFTGASSFNGSVTGWDVANVTSMHNMFLYASSFNGNVSNWDVKSVRDFSYMFTDATSFNQDLSNWDLDSALEIRGMFKGARSFNGSVTGWDVANITNMSSVFEGAVEFNQPLDSWNVGNVTDMRVMLAEAASFNQNISNWDVANVTNMNSMLYKAVSYDQAMSTWDVSSVADMSGMFAEASSFDQNIANWNTGAVQYMGGMFNGATNFNQPLNNWDVSGVIDMSQMFFLATSFNQPLNNWDVGSLQYMRSMFHIASSFNQDVSAWNVSNVTSMRNAFFSSSISSQAYDNMLVSWSQLPLQSDVELGVDATYCATGARQYIIQTFSWSITDYGQNCSTNFEESLSTESLISSGLPSGSLVGVLTPTGFSERQNQPYSLGCDDRGPDDSLFAVVDNELRLSASLRFENPQDEDGDNVYQVCIRAFNTSGVAIDTEMTVRVRAQSGISGVEFSEVNNQKVMTVSGTGFNDGGGVQAALVRSLVRLNNSDLPFCSQGFGMDAATIIAVFSGELPGGMDPALVSDNPPCYLLLEFNPSDPDTFPVILFTSTKVTILLPEDFDITERGTVSIDGSAVYTFNGVDPVDPEHVNPTANVNGNKELDQKPTIPKRPVFSGIATPGAIVKVTVRSDPISCTATADSTGNWSCKLPSDLAPGQHTVTIRIVNPDNSVEELGPYAVFVAAGANGPTVVDSQTPFAPNAGFMQILQDSQQQKSEQNVRAVLAAALLIVSITAVVALMLKRKLRTPGFRA